MAERPDLFPPGEHDPLRRLPPAVGEALRTDLGALGPGPALARWTGVQEELGRLLRGLRLGEELAAGLPDEAACAWARSLGAAPPPPAFTLPPASPRYLSAVVAWSAIAAGHGPAWLGALRGQAPPELLDLLEADATLAEGRVGRADMLYRRAAEACPEPWALVGLGDTLCARARSGQEAAGGAEAEAEAMARYDEALDAALAALPALHRLLALRQPPPDGRLLARLGDRLLAAGHPEQALQAAGWMRASGAPAPAEAERRAQRLEALVAAVQGALPDAARRLVEVARSATDTGDWGGAILPLEVALRSADPPPEVRGNLGQALFHAAFRPIVPWWDPERLRAAREVLEAGTAPTAWALTYHGRVLTALASFEPDPRACWIDAARRFERALELDPAQVDAWTGLSTALQQLDLLGLSAVAAREAGRRAPEDGAAWEAQVIAEVNRGEHALALHLARRPPTLVLGQWDDFVEAFIQVQSGRHLSEAAASLARGRFGPRDAWQRHTRARCHLARGEVQAAIAEWQELWRLRPDPADREATLNASAEQCWLTAARLAGLLDDPALGEAAVAYADAVAPVVGWRLEARWSRSVLSGLRALARGEGPQAILAAVDPAVPPRWLEELVEVELACAARFPGASAEAVAQAAARVRAARVAARGPSLEEERDRLQALGLGGAWATPRRLGDDAARHGDLDLALARWGDAAPDAGLDAARALVLAAKGAVDPLAALLSPPTEALEAAWEVLASPLFDPPVEQALRGAALPPAHRAAARALLLGASQHRRPLPGAASPPEALGELPLRLEADARLFGEDPQPAAAERLTGELIPALRARLREELGIELPGVRLTAHEGYWVGGYGIRLAEVGVATGTVHPDRRFVQPPPEGADATEAPWGGSGAWVEGASGLDWPAFMAAHLADLVRRHMATFVGHDDLDRRLRALGHTLPPARLSAVVALARGLAADRVPLTRPDLLVEHSPASLDAPSLPEAMARVRAAMRPALWGNQRDRACISPTPAWEAALRAGTTDHGLRLALPPESLQSLLRAVRAAAEACPQASLVVADPLRHPVARVLAFELPELPVLSRTEWLGQAPPAALVDLEVR